jgi:predicted AAA+ superfamily ATPase
MSKNTVERYIDLLEKSFVIFRLTGFSRNLRKEITKNNRYFFSDVGIRNAVVGMFNTLNLRDDTGKLWENYIISEILKHREYCRLSPRFYFWRTYDKKEIDLIQDHAGKLNGFEIKWRKSRTRAPKDWSQYYPNAGFEVIHKDNYLNYILKQDNNW